MSETELKKNKLIRTIKSTKPTRKVFAKVCFEKHCQWRNGTGVCCLPCCMKGVCGK